MHEARACLNDSEHPLDLDARCIGRAGPRVALGGEGSEIGDAPVETLVDEYADLYLDHVEPAGVLGRVVEFQAAQDPSCLFGWKRFVDSPCAVRRKVVEDDLDAIAARVGGVNELAHALGEVYVGAPLGNLGVAPRCMGVDEHEDVGGAVAPVLVIRARRTSRRWRHGNTRFADQLPRRFIEANDRRAWRWWGRVQLQNVLHAGDELRVDLWNAPHFALPGLEVVFDEAAPDGVARDLFVARQTHHSVGK